MPGYERQFFAALSLSLQVGQTSCRLGSATLVTDVITTGQDTAHMVI